VRPPSAMPVSVTILDNAALGRASTIVRLLTRTAGSPLVTAATGALTGQLRLTSAICAALVALLLTVPRLLPHLGPDAGAPTPGNRGDNS
jgi:hypothetical protein